MKKPGRDLSYKGVQLRDLDRPDLYAIIDDLTHGRVTHVGHTIDDVRYRTPNAVDAALAEYDRREPF